MLQANDIRESLDMLGRLLDERNERFDAIILGGANLLVSGVIERPTIDIDVVAQLGSDGEVLTAIPLPTAVQEAVAVVAQLRGLPSDWLNSVSGSEIQFGLPRGCVGRLREERFGGLTAWWVHRHDLVAYKVVAAVDHLVYPTNKHLDDLEALHPTPEDLDHAVDWFRKITAPQSGSFVGLAAVLERFGHELR